MKILISAVIAFTLAATLGSFSTTAVGAVEGSKTNEPSDLITTVVEKIDGVVAAIHHGFKLDAHQLAEQIKNAEDLAQKINVNDKVARENSKATKFFNAAIRSTKAGDFQATEDHLAKAKEIIQGLRKLL